MENVLMQLPATGIEFRGVRKGAWTPEEDLLLKRCIEKYGEGRWHLVPTRAGLRRCRKSCRLRWLNYLKPTIRRGTFDEDEVDLIIRLHRLLGNRWSLIAGRIPGRTANDIKNYWNSSLGKKVNPNWPQGVVHNNVPAGSSAAERNPSPLTEESYPLKEHTPSHPAGIRGSTPNGAPPSSVIRPQPRIPSKTNFPLPMVNTCHKTRCEPSATDNNAAKEEYSLSWLKILLGDDGEDEEQRQQQWEQENVVSFTSHSRAGEVELLDGSHWTEEIECWEQWGLKDTSGGAHQPLGLLQPEPRIPTTTAFPLPMTETCHKTGHKPSATDGEAAQVEDHLPWLRKLPWDKDEDEEEQEQERQGEQKIIVSFPDRSQEGAADDLDMNPYWSEVINGWGWGGFENAFLGAHLPLGLVQPDVDGTNQAPNGNDGKHG